MPFTREGKILKGIDKHKLGLEIGPSHRPIAAKRNGFNVRVLDHLSAEELRTKYAEHGVDLASIEEVDYVWKGEPLDELVKGERFAWIIASHVIEHSPNPVGFLRDCEAILAEGGVVSLAVPDKRFCFDFVREISSLAQVIDAHIANRHVHSVGAVADYFMNVVNRNGMIAWNAHERGPLTFAHTVSDAVRLMPVALAGEYIDLHGWCFTPASFRLLLIDLNLLGFIGLKEDGYFETVGHEFFVTLKVGKATADDRMALQMMKLKEIRDAAL